MRRADKIIQRGTFASTDAAAEVLKEPGDTTVITRGVPRLLMMKCPCGCGDNLILNLDRRAGPAWRVYVKGASLTLYPSYWRDTKCESHFIIWNNRVVWCDWRDYSPLWEQPSEIEGRVFAVLSKDFVSYEQLSEQLEETPWDVLQACRALVRKEQAVAHSDWRTGQFRRL